MRIYKNVFKCIDALSGVSMQRRYIILTRLANVFILLETVHKKTLEGRFT